MEKIKLFNPKKELPRRSDDDLGHSIDVFTIDQSGMHGLAFYSYTQHKWLFHTDTLIDYFEEGNETMFKWYYPPINLEDVEWI